MGASNRQLKVERQLIVVSGYYGFDNLGDEAILEELIGELTNFVDKQNIVILSQNPEVTAARYGVRAQDRWQLADIASLLSQTRLFISGGGGLFQDTESVKSVIYYGGLVSMARALGAKVLVYAQGIGPIKSTLGKYLTRTSLALSHALTVRDAESVTLLSGWGLSASLTGDPVWLLSAEQLPESARKFIADLRKENRGKKLVGLSLRQGGGFDDGHIEMLAKAMQEAGLTKNHIIVPIPLQTAQDIKPLEAFVSTWTALGGKIASPHLGELEKPSQWLKLIGSLDLVVGMRLHSLIMALSSGVPCVGIAYDPKVTNVLEKFAQPNLPYVRGEKPKDDAAVAWQKTLAQTISTQGDKAARKSIEEKLKEVREGATLNINALGHFLSPVSK